MFWLPWPAVRAARKVAISGQRRREAQSKGKRFAAVSYHISTYPQENLREEKFSEH
jgi:hypothetical protein